MSDDLDPVGGAITTLYFYLQVANMVSVVLHSHKLLAIFTPCYFFLIALEYTPPLPSIYFILFIIYFLVSGDNITYRCITTNLIQIYFNLIDNYWITDIYNKLFLTYIDKVKYCFIIDMECFKAYVVY